LRDKDAVANHLTGSHDYHLSRIDAQEETFLTGLTKDLDLLVAQAHAYERKRHRSRLREVVLFQERCLIEVEQAEESAA
jgi:hypothetical protein